MNAKILVVDDDPLVCTAMRLTLESAGYGVLIAEDGEEALQQVGIHRPDLVLLDVNIPTMNGFEVLSHLRNDPDLSSTVVLFVSSLRVDRDSQIHGLEAGADGYITRPITNREMLARVQATLRTKAAEDAMRQKERQLRDLIANNIDGMLVVDRSGQALFANPSASALLDRAPEIIQGQTIGIPVTADEHTELDLVRPDGGRRVVEMRVVEIEWHSQPAFLVALRDITERRQIEEMREEYAARLEAEVTQRTQELQDAQEQLVRQERLAVLGRLAGSVGHELRNPLAVINNAIYFLRLIQPNAEPKIQQYLDIIASEIRSADKIVRDLLDFSRIHTVDREKINVAQLVQSTLQRFPSPTTVTVRLNLPDKLPQTFADPHQLEQVLGNLIVNAYQAMPNGGELTLTAAYTQQGPATADADLAAGWLTITVQDTGIGIAPQTMPKIFEPLFTTKARGIGLGLAVSQKLVEANGGCITVQSEEGQGSTFTIYLPAGEGHL
jgi:signal transduction histidine kinase